MPEAHGLCALHEALLLPEASDKVFGVKLSINDVNFLINTPTCTDLRCV